MREGNGVAKIFIDGNAGTTGLRIVERLKQREDLELLTLPAAQRKNPEAKAEVLSAADVVILCVPDSVARESVELISQLDENQPVVIDSSTAHRTDTQWVYGLPELHGGAHRIKNAKKIANPGCHATGFIVLVAPLIAAGVLDPKTALSCTSLTGYSGGGKAMIAQYENANEKTEGGENGSGGNESADSTADAPNLLHAPRMYGLGQTHKHLPEMQIISGLQTPPVFMPIVANYYSGMEVVVPLDESQLQSKMSRTELEDLYHDYYQSAEESSVYVAPSADESGFLSAARFAGRDDLEISVHGNEQRVVLTARFDNLGKGASGAAIQNLNLVLGMPALSGLNIAGETK